MSSLSSLSSSSSNESNVVKRKRCENWTEHEKQTLLALVEERISIIESKQTDTKTNKKKQSAWREVEEKFHMVMPTTRTIDQLKQQWKRMKVLARKSIAQYKKGQKAPGGGQNTSVVTEMDWRIHNLLPHGFIKQPNRSDDDNETNADSIHFKQETPCHGGTQASNDASATSTLTARNNWSHRIHTSIRTPRSRNLRQNRASKSKRHQLLIDWKTEEYDLKLRHMNEIHEMEMKRRTIEVENLLLMQEYIKLELERKKESNCKI